jgi:hypothetical protein
VSRILCVLIKTHFGCAKIVAVAEPVAGACDELLGSHHELLWRLRLVHQRHLHRLGR